MSVFLVVGSFLTWRSTLGFDLRDSAYVTAIAQRMARGETPFVDELNPHSFGSLPAVPSLWLWHHIVGTSGVVLLGRLTFVVLVGLASVVAWRALSPHAGRTISAVAIATAVLALPYNQLVVSYNTTPQLALMVASCAGVAAVARGSRGWAAACGTSAMVASIGYFAVLPAAMVLIGSTLVGRALWVHGRPERAWVFSLLGSGLLVGLVFLGWLTLVPGWGAVRDSLALLDSGAGDRGIGVEPFYWHFVAGARLLPLALLVATMSVAIRWPRGVREVLLGGAVALLALWGGEWGPPGQEPTAGKYAGAVALALLVVLAPAMTIWLGRRRDRLLLLVVLIALPAAVVGFIATSAVTLSGAAYGAYAVPLSGMIVLIVLVLNAVVTDGGAPRWTQPIVFLPAVAMVASLLSVVFNEGPVVTTTTRLAEGPGAGLSVGVDSGSDYAAVARLVAACTDPGGGLWAPGVPGAYLWVDRSAGVPQYWLSPHEFTSGLRVLGAVGTDPACVLAPSDTSPGGQGEPLARWLDDGYERRTSERLRTVGEDGTRYALFEKLPDEEALRSAAAQQQLTPGSS
ncbi:hypothetical protein ASG73_08185 [Janibacter sp. Soil728]|nr:hypothetical protein ASG73_08185 [Janibacter sp. Soil728]